MIDALAAADPSGSLDEVAAPPGRGAAGTSPLAIAAAPADFARLEAGIMKLGGALARAFLAIVFSPGIFGAPGGVA